MYLDIVLVWSVQGEELCLSWVGRLQVRGAEGVAVHERADSVWVRRYGAPPGLQVCQTLLAEHLVCLVL